MSFQAKKTLWFLWEDLKFGSRILRKSPAFTAAAVTTLALSIGVTSAVFSIINSVMLQPLPYHEPQRLMVMWGTDKRPPSPDGVSVSEIDRNKMMVRSDVPERWSQVSRSFDEIATYRGWSFNVTVGDAPERVESGLVSADFFSCLRVPPALGRTFEPAEMDPGNDHVVVLGYSFWRRRFGSGVNAVGQTIRIDGVLHTVIGVMPESFRTILPFIRPNVDLWAPISREYRDKRRWSIVTAIGRLKPGVSQQQAQFEMDEISRQLEPEGRKFQDRGVNLVRLDREVVSGSRHGLLVVFGAVGCVLLIACANLAGLLLAHTRSREKEIAIRSALGATRGRILTQFLTECLLLSTMGGVGGLLLATWIARAFVLLEPGDIPRIDQVHTDGAVFLFGIALSVVSGVLFGLIPAVQSSRVNFAGSLKRTSHKTGRGRLGLNPRRLLLIVEVGLTMMLLAGTGLLLRSFALLKAVDPGFQTDGLLAMMIPLPETSYSTPKAQAEFARELLERAQLIPNVESVAISNSLPMQNRFLFGMHLAIEGRKLPEDTTIAVRAVSAGYFRTMRIPFIRGRDFSPADEGKEDTAVVNRETADRFWAGSDPIGQRLVLENGKPRTIVGVVSNVKSGSPDADSEIEVYLPFVEEPAPYLGLVVRSAGDPRTLASSVSAAVRAIDPNQPVAEVAGMRETLGEFFARPRFNLVLLGSFAALALTLSLIGIYAVISHSVTQRTNEIGIRIALGAQRRNVLFLFLRDGALVAVAGISIGLIGALAATRLLTAMLFGIAPQDGVTFAAVSLMFLIICLSASYFPARRALKVDPIVALRHE